MGHAPIVWARPWEISRALSVPLFSREGSYASKTRTLSAKGKAPRELGKLRNHGIGSKGRSSEGEVRVQKRPFSISGAKHGRSVPFFRGTPHLVLVNDELEERGNMGRRGDSARGSAAPARDRCRTELTPSSPTGPRACVLPVLTPTSVPKPYRKPSAKRVLALT